jgi:YVTN family beta-propeller protein
MSRSVPAMRTSQSTSTRTIRARQLATGLRVGLLSILTVGLACAVGQAQTLVATVPSGPGPVAVAVNQTTNMVYVADDDIKTLLVINGVTNTATTIPAGGPLADVAVNPTTNTIYALNGGSQSSGLGGTVVTPGSVAVINGATNAVTATIALPGLASFIAVNPVTNQIYVSTLSGPVGNGVTGNVVAIDGSTNSITATVPMPALISQMGVDTLRNLIYVIYSTGSGNFNPSSVAAIDGATNTVAATVLVGINDGHFALNEKTNTIYVPDTHFSDIYVIDGATLSVTATVPWTGSLYANGLATNPVTNTIYIFNSNSNGFFLSSMDGTTNAVTGTVSDPTYLSGYGSLLVNSVTNQIWQPGTPVSVVDAAAGTATTVTGPTGVLLGALNTTTNYVYMAAANSVYVISGAPAGPAFSASPSPLAFGNQTQGKTSSAMTLTITNTGTANLTITTVTPGGTNMADFPVGTDTCSNATVAAGKTCTVSVEFEPSTKASETATLTFADNVSGSPQTVNLTGTGVAPVATPTTTTLSASSTSVAVGTGVTLTATVAPASGTPTPTGTVTFKDGATTLGTGTLNGSGVATYTASALALGSHTITASYGGDARNIASTSSSVTVVITAGSTSTALTVSASSIAVGSSVTFTATVTGASPTGTVTFKNGSTTLGTGTLNGSGVATYTSSALATGSYSVTAAYGGDADNASSTSSAVALTVYAGAPAFTLTLDPATGSFAAGKKAVITVTVASVNGFNAATNLACSDLPKNTTCTFSSPSVTPAVGGTATSTLTIATDTHSSATALQQGPSRKTPNRSPIRSEVVLAGAFAAFLLLPLLGAKNRKIRRRLLTLSSLILIAAMISLGMTGCTGGPTTPKGTYTIQVTGTAGSLSQNATYALTVQ